jgi:hypothetical protein
LSIFHLGRAVDRHFCIVPRLIYTDGYRRELTKLIERELSRDWSNNKYYPCPAVVCFM